ncbi:MAG: hypothetical protein HOV81_18685 [Kofleriaceae bacterium]|nr:hypothetical protein [Kofleriaceae bacterium]
MVESERSPATGIVAILAILLVIALTSFIAWRADVFGGRDHEARLHTTSASR